MAGLTPQTAEGSKTPPSRSAEDRQPDLILMIACLCDAMKRLEWAIQSSGDDRNFYIEEAKIRREIVERKLLDLHS